MADLFDLHAPALFRFATAMLRDPDAAQDIVQEAFVRLMHHVSSGGALPNARGWLFTVVAHACRDRQRRAWRWLPWTQDQDRRRSAAPADTFAERELLRVALVRLRPRDRLLVSLRAQELSYQEIAEAAGIRAVSVGRLLGRALDRLAGELARLREIST